MKCIVFIINEQYSHPFHVVLTSLIVNNQNLGVDIIVMYDGELSEKTIQTSYKIYPRINFLRVKNELILYDRLIKYRTDQWINKNYSVFSRFEIFDLEQYNKIVYIDTDTVITNKIDYLLNDCDIDECYAVKHEERNYFNAGVMVINKKESFQTYKNRCIDIIKKSKELQGNQSIFNKCFEKSTHLIDCKYNLTTRHSEAYNYLKNNSEVILHFPGAKKPWDEIKFSNYYGSCNEYIKNEFLNKWYTYEKIFNDAYNNL